MPGEAGSPQAAERVDRTGLALVHAGEIIYAGATAQAATAPAGAAVVNYYFPVEIEVLGVGAADALAERIFKALQRELDALG